MPCFLTVRLAVAVQSVPLTLHSTLYFKATETSATAANQLPPDLSQRTRHISTLRRPGRAYYKAQHTTRRVPRSASHQLHDISSPPPISSKFSFSTLFFACLLCGLECVASRSRHKPPLPSFLGGPKPWTSNPPRYTPHSRHQNLLGSFAHDVDLNLGSDLACCC